VYQGRQGGKEGVILFIFEAERTAEESGGNAAAAVADAAEVFKIFAADQLKDVACGGAPIITEDKGIFAADEDDVAAGEGEFEILSGDLEAATAAKNGDDCTLKRGRIVGEVGDVQ